MIQNILQLCCDQYEGVSVKDVVGKKRYQEIGTVRELCARMLRMEGLTLEQIGAVINRDHSTVSYLLTKIATKQMLDDMRAVLKKLQL